MTKRLFTLFLALAMIFSLVPTSAFASDTAQTDVDTGEMTVEGTNSVGNLISESILENMEQQEESEAAHQGYSLTDLEIDGNVATVTYDSLEDAILVVALYTEDGMQLITSAKTDVSPDETEATITFDGEMPEYFLAEAFLMDVYDCSPLCPSYETPMYTSDMQQLLASTIDDYDADRVYNLDEDRNTNFAVFSENAIIIEQTSDTNTVVSIDDENFIYVFENADAQITSLQPGDVVAYLYGQDDLLLFKVDSVTVDGTTATVAGCELEIKEIFAYLKLESAGDSSVISLDTSETDDGITFEGMDYGVQTWAWENQMDGEVSYEFKLDKKFEDATSDGSIEAEVEIKGSLKFSVKVDISYYISLKRQFVEFKATAGATLGVEVSGKLDINAWKLGEFGYDPIPSVKIKFKPRITLRFSGKISLSAKYSYTVGMRIEHRALGNFTVKNLCTTPKLETEFEFEGKVFFGIDMHPSVSLVKSTIATVEMEGLVGIEISGTLKKQSHPEGNPNALMVHDCTMCLDGDISLIIKIEVTAKFLNNKRLSLKATLVDLKHKLKDFYYSYDQEELGWGECPHYRFQVRIITKDDDEKLIGDIPVFLSDGTELGTSNSNGLVENVYLAKGKYTFKADIEGQPVVYTQEIDNYCSIILTSCKAYWERLEKMKKLMITPDSALVGSKYKSGVCGSDVTWTLYHGGLLVITGTGAMDSYALSSLAPWYDYRDRITSVHVQSGVTNVGSYAFYGHTALQKVVLDDTVATLGANAFKNCSGLKQVKIPCDTDSTAFSGCSNVENIHYTPGRTGRMNYRYESNKYSTYYPNMLEYIARNHLKSAYFDSGITYIASYVFSDAKALTDVSLPTTLSQIGINTFQYCTALKEIYIPEGTIRLGDYCFYGCSSLQAINFPSTISTIYTYSFASCTSLEEVVIPDTVTKVISNAFSSCSGLKKITMPVDLPLATNLYSIFGGTTNVETIHYTYGRTGKMTVRSSRAGDYDYYGRTLEYISRNSIKNIYFDKGISFVANYAMYYMTALENVWFAGDAPSIEEYAFGGTTTTVNYPTGNTTWSNCRGKNYNGTLTWKTYSVPTVANSTMTQSPLAARGVFDGENQTELTEENTVVQVTSFEGLVPGAQYVMLAVISMDAEDLLSGDNLLAIDQGIAGEDGTLSFRYVQRVAVDQFYTFVCGASDQDLSDAVISVPSYISNGEAQAVEPTVTYNGQVLMEGIHYVIADGGVFTNPGEYTCTLRGIRDYSGTVQFTYTVSEAPKLTLQYPTVSLEDELIVNIYFSAENMEDVPAYHMGLLIFSEKVAEGTIENAEDFVFGAVLDDSVGLYCANIEGIAAKEFGDWIYFCVFAQLPDGTFVYSKVVSYSPMTYAYSVLNGNYSDEMKALMGAMLNYSAAAQLYFDYNTDMLVNRNMTDEQKALVAEFDADMIAPIVKPDSAKIGSFVKNGGFSKVYPSISLESAFCINYFFVPAYAVDGDVMLYYWTSSDYNSAESLTEENASGVMIASAGTEYAAFVDGIAAKNIDSTVYVSVVYQSGGETYCSGVLPYSIGAYCQDRVVNGSAEMQTLASATAVYGYYAREYFIG